MKTLKKSILLLFAVAVVFSMTVSIVSCSKDDEDTEEKPKAGFSVALPESVGENPFAGKSYDYEEGFMGTTPGRVVFTDSTLTITNKKNHKWFFQYTYDATQKLIYCGWVSESGKGATIYTVSDYVNMYKNELVTDDTISYYTDKGTASYTTMKIYSYEQTDSSLTMSEGYFTGALPSCAEFEIPNSGSSPYNISYDNEEFTINDNNSSSKSKYHLFVLCNENPFSATLYQKLNGEYAKVGTAKGSYTATGTGISDCTLKITFTELPDEVTVITKNTEYTLPQHQKSITEMTLSN